VPARSWQEDDDLRERPWMSKSSREAAESAQRDFANGRGLNDK